MKRPTCFQELVRAAANESGRRGQASQVARPDIGSVRERYDYRQNGGKIGGKCVSMSVTIRPASLWTHFMFAAIAKAKGRAIQLGSGPDLREELRTWLSLQFTSRDRQW